MNHLWPGHDLLDVYRPGSGLTPRKVLSFVEQLPDTSATVAAAMGGDRFRGWGVDRNALVGLYDMWAKNPFPRPEAGPRVLDFEDY